MARVTTGITSSHIPALGAAIQANALAGNAGADCGVPDEAMEVDVSSPDQVVGDGTPASCTSAAGSRTSKDSAVRSAATKRSARAPAAVSCSISKLLLVSFV